MQQNEELGAKLKQYAEISSVPFLIIKTSLQVDISVNSYSLHKR